MEFRDWNGRAISAARSRGGVVAVEDFSDNLLRTPGCWPTPEVFQKLYQSRQEVSFDGTARQTVTRKLGYYCDLQSIHSEDAITWSFFGPLIQAPTSVRVEFLNDLLHMSAGAPRETSCDISLWRRIAHPDKPVSGGPEIDFLLIGSGTVVLGEAKWRSGEGIGQGVDRNKGQVQLRKEFAQTLGSRIFPGHRFVVVTVSLVKSRQGLQEARDIPLVRATWADLASFEGHPAHREFCRYFDWKVANSRPVRNDRVARGSQDAG